MRIEFDKAKDRRNRAKHGLSLGLAAKLDWDSMLLGGLHNGDHGTLRIISLRRATNTEIERYETQGHK
jgi:uncharacterized DUF497 family protein